MAAPSYPNLGFGKIKFTRNALGAALRHTIKRSEESLFELVELGRDKERFLASLGMTNKSSRRTYCYSSSNVKFAFVKIQISLAIRMASCAIAVADSFVCLDKARAAASAKGPPEPMAQMPSSGSITSPFPDTRYVDLLSATIRSASRCRNARSLRHSFASSTADFARFP